MQRMCTKFLQVEISKSLKIQNNMLLGIIIAQSCFYLLIYVYLLISANRTLLRKKCIVVLVDLKLYEHDEGRFKHISDING